MIEEKIRKIRLKYGKKRSDITFKYSVKYQKLADEQIKKIQDKYDKKRDRQLDKKYKLYDKQMAEEIRTVQQKSKGKKVKTKPKATIRKTTNQLKQVLLTLMQKYVRLRDSDERGMGSCISCGVRVHRKKANGGHYIIRSINSTTFDIRNINLQCIACNGFRAGNQIGYRKGLIKKYGLEVVQELEAKKHVTKKLDRLWIEEQIKEYKEWVKILEQKKK